MGLHPKYKKHLKKVPRLTQNEICPYAFRICRLATHDTNHSLAPLRLERSDYVAEEKLAHNTRSLVKRRVVV
jgi:hypothetical protein